MNLIMELWDDCSYYEEFENCKNIINSEDETIYLIKNNEDYVAFIHISIRKDYVEGSNSLPVAYIEAIYVKSEFRKNGLARSLILIAENWAKQKGLKKLASDAENENLQSIDFHKSVGFDEVGRIVCFIKNI
jgi:aminoglycoside 6'-N-acetyltransferase I